MVPCLPAYSLTKQGHVSVWPMDLQQVDVVCAQALQALVQGLLNI
jgi:hypothetical protein